MSQLAFEIIGSKAEHYTPFPQITLRVRITESSGADIYSISLRAQVNLEPQRRRYAAGESDRLLDLFGPPARYGDTLRAMLWTNVGTNVVAFKDSIEVDLALPCSYDFDIGANKFLAALDGGEIPIVLYFNGTVFERGPSGISADIVPWACEAHYRIPLVQWKETLDALFPGCAWLRIDRDVFDELHRFKSAAGYPTWEATLKALLEAAKVGK